MGKMTKQFFTIILTILIMPFITEVTKAQIDWEDEDLLLKTERTTHPDAQWFPDAGLGLFMHWDTACLHNDNVWSCFVREEKPYYISDFHRVLNI